MRPRVLNFLQRCAAGTARIYELRGCGLTVRRFTPTEKITGSIPVGPLLLIVP